MILTNRLSPEREAELRRRMETADRRRQTVAERKYNPFGASPPRPAIAESAEDYEKRARLMQESRFTAAVSGGCCGC